MTIFSLNSRKKMVLKEFNRDYEYKRDIVTNKRKENWSILERDEDGKFRGDCEDYSLTLKYKVKGFEDLQLWYCYVNINGKEEGHIVSRLEDRDCWIDNNVQRCVGKLPRGYRLIRRVYPIEIWVKVIWYRVLNKLRVFMKR